MRTKFDGKVGESMTYTPFGYIIEDGKTGIDKTHSMIGRFLKNKVYVGTEYYPQIVDGDIFAKAQEIRESNARSQNRIRAYTVHPKV